MAKLPQEVTRAIALAEAAEWPIRAANGKIVIVAPDGTALTIGARPNEASLKVWRSECRRYNLDGDGPAMTPEQQKEMAMATAAAPKSTPNPAAVKKAAEAAAAKEKADAAARGEGPAPAAPKAAPVTVPVVTFTPPAAPAVTPKVTAAPAKPAADKPKTDKDGFPVFNPQMLAVEDYSAYQLASGPNKGRYFCPNCWERGDKATFKAPQGLASHLGFRHAAFTLASKDAAAPAKLPEAIQTALELLTGALVEELTDTADANQVRDLEKKVAELSGLLKEKSAKITELEGQLKGALDLAKERGTALDQVGAKHEAEVKMLLGRFEKDLAEFRGWVNELPPAIAVGKVLETVEKYLKK